MCYSVSSTRLMNLPVSSTVIQAMIAQDNLTTQGSSTTHNDVETQEKM